MRLMVYEGTPEEISQVAATLRPMAVPEVPSDAPPVADTSGSTPAGSEKKERVYISVQVARRMLSRRPLASEQLRVLKAIYEAYPDRVPAPKLQKLVGYTPAQFAGLMGAFGRRMSHTRGYVGDAWLFDSAWDYDKGHFLYGLPETVCEALRQEGIV